MFIHNAAYAGIDLRKILSQLTWKAQGQIKGC